MRMTVIVLAALAVSASPARSAPTPDPGELSRLHATASEWNRFRITTDHSQFTVTSLQFDSERVVVRQPQRRPAMIAAADATVGEIKRVSWSEVERIEGMRSHSLRSAMVGALVGGLLGFGAKATFEGDLHDASPVAIVAIPIGALLGAVVGASVGGTTGWHRLYP